MAGRRTFASRFGYLFFLGCLGIVGAGYWYLENRELFEEDDEQEVADDEGTRVLKADGGAPRRRSKKKASQAKGKPSEPRHPRSPARQAGNLTPPGAGPSGPSYESAIAGSNLNLAPGTNDAPDLSDSELAGPMRDGTFLDTCEVPTSTHVTVKVAIRNGRAVGVSVYPVPPSQEIAGCVQRHVRTIQWPSNAKMDSFITTY
jgi:hypothetical protein